MVSGGAAHLDLLELLFRYCEQFLFGRALVFHEAFEYLVNQQAAVHVRDLGFVVLGRRRDAQYPAEEVPVWTVCERFKRAWGYGAFRRASIFELGTLRTYQAVPLGQPVARAGDTGVNGADHPGVLRYCGMPLYVFGWKANHV